MKDLGTRGGVKSGWIAIGFLASFAASVAVTVVYAKGGQPQLEGILLGVALGGISLGLIGWAKAFFPHGPHVEERSTIPSELAELPTVVSTFTEGVEDIGRRRFLGRLLGLAVVALGGAAVFPIRSLGTAPGRQLAKTAWRNGARAVREDGTFVRASDVPIDGILTIFPEGHTDDGDVPAVLVHLREGLYQAPPHRADWAPNGYVAFSKLCTHAGCPVGLYQAASKQLYCPCHQSVFNVLQGARPVSGPATRPLPQLPLRIDANGFIVAMGDFSDPVGPGYWTILKDKP
jgi:ubiquinol-cytochrome c reductase iron-sulfur subunit